MSRRIITLLLSLVIFHACSQDSPKEEFVKSFRKHNQNTIVDFSSLANESNPMSKQEAIEFVYHDSARLYCYQKIINMETEKVSRINRSLYLPDKLLLIDADNYYLIGHTYYECQDPNKFLFKYIQLKVIDKAFNVTDSLIVYKANEFDYDITGLFNAAKNRLFLVGKFDQQKGYDALLLMVNARLKFEKIDERTEVKTSDNLYKVAERLGWQTNFVNHD